MGEGAALTRWGRTGASATRGSEVRDVTKKWTNAAVDLA